MKVKLLAKACVAILLGSLSVPVAAFAVEGGNSTLSNGNCKFYTASGLGAAGLYGGNVPTTLTVAASGIYIITRTITAEFIVSQPGDSYTYFIPVGNEITYFNPSNGQFYTQYPLINNGLTVSGTYSGTFNVNAADGHTATLTLSCGGTMTIQTVASGS